MRNTMKLLSGDDLIAGGMKRYIQRGVVRQDMLSIASKQPQLFNCSLFPPKTLKCAEIVFAWILILLTGP